MHDAVHQIHRVAGYHWPRQPVRHWTRISQINDRNMVIASACEEQANVARVVDRNLVNIQDLSTQTAAGAHQTNASTQELSSLAVSFNTLVGRFRL